MALTHARRIGVLVGGIAIAGASALSGCSQTAEKPAPASSSVQVSPTEKKIPTLSPGGPNQIAPSGQGPTEPTALPGNGTSGR